MTHQTLQGARVAPTAAPSPEALRLAQQAAVALLEGDTEAWEALQWAAQALGMGAAAFTQATVEAAFTEGYDFGQEVAA
jgi:hypothetical protein